MGVFIFDHRRIYFPERVYNGENLNVETEEGIDSEDNVQVVLNDEVKKQSSIVAFAAMMSGKEPQDLPKKPSKYRKYTTEQITQFLIRITENMESVRKAAAAEGITERSAYRYKKQWNEFGTVIRLKRSRKIGTVSQLKDEHGDFLIRLVDKKAEITIAAMH
ncbi:hypothetical protein RMCBS344292_03011 [Rhizopus microsporus]|nr:hypothetical protein RMCBS344292_03011 [Rhizopus microsporus]